MTIVCRTPREVVWPVEIGGNRGWPLPDAAWDPCGSGRWATTTPAGWLPWAVWQAEPEWYVAFYTCDRGHAWTCGYGSLAGYSELRRYRLSPERIVPSDEYLRRHVGEPVVDSPATDRLATIMIRASNATTAIVLIPGKHGALTCHLSDGVNEGTDMLPTPNTGTDVSPVNPLIDRGVTDMSRPSVSPEESDTDLLDQLRLLGEDGPA